MKFTPRACHRFRRGLCVRAGLDRHHTNDNQDDVLHWVSSFPKYVPWFMWCRVAQMSFDCRTEMASHRQAIEVNLIQIPGFGGCWGAHVPAGGPGRA